MSDPLTTSSPASRASRITAMAPAALGLVLAVCAAWRWGSTLVEVFRYPGSPSFWLEVGATAPLCLLSCLGGVWLLRGRSVGFFAFYAVVVVSLARWPLPEWRTNLVLLAFLVATQVATRRSRTEGGRARRWSLLKLGLGVCVAVPMILACRYAQGGIENVAGAIVRQGIDASEAGKPEEALARWHRVIDRYPHTSAWGVAVYNSGLVHMEQGRFEEAIRLFEILLAGTVNDLEPGAELMETNRNYRHHASLGLSTCYEKMGDMEEALRYARLARDRYPFQSWCGTCLMGAHKHVRERISRLEGKLGVQGEGEDRIQKRENP